MDKQADNLRIRATQLGRLGVSPGAALRMVSLLKEGNNVWRKQRSKVGFRWVKVVPNNSHGEY